MDKNTDKPINFKEYKDKKENEQSPYNGEKTDKEERPRPGMKTRFGMPGGNKPGRKPLTEEQKQAMQLIRDHAPDAVKTVLEVMKDKRTRSADRLRASEIVLDRAYGKSPAIVNLSPGDNTIMQEIRAELEALRAEMPDEDQQTGIQ